MDVVAKITYTITKNCETTDEAEAFVGSVKKSFLETANVDGYKTTQGKEMSFTKKMATGEREEVSFTTNYDGE